MAAPPLAVTPQRRLLTASWFETRGVAALLTMRVSDLILRSVAKRCVSKDEARDGADNYRPVFTLVHNRLMMRWVAGSRAVITNSFFSVASSG